MGGFIVNGKAVSDEEAIASIVRFGAIDAANRLMRCFYADGNPAWILRACESLRHDNIAVPTAWLNAEAWARAHRRPRGRPTKAAQMVRLVELRGVAARLWPTKPTGETHRWLARETGLRLGHVRVVLHRHDKRRNRPLSRHPTWLQPRRPRGIS